jgi:hypothetical protein
MQLSCLIDEQLVSDDDQHECSKKERFLFDLSADFRDQMVTSVRNFSGSKNNGLFINSCFAHCQSEMPFTWNNQPGGSPALQNKVVPPFFFYCYY